VAAKKHFLKQRKTSQQKYPISVMSYELKFQHGKLVRNDEDEWHQLLWKLAENQPVMPYEKPGNSYSKREKKKYNVDHIWPPTQIRQLTGWHSASKADI